MNKQDEEKAKKIVNNIFSLGLNTNRSFYDMAYNSALEMAAWKEQQMIEKACNWFEKNWTMYTYPSHLMFEDFKKYMEEN